MKEQIRVGDESTSLYVTRPQSADAGVVLLHAWWGLNEDVLAFAERIAAHGFVVAAPDLYQGKLATTIEDADRLGSALSEELADGFALAATDALSELLGGPDVPVATIGFSLGAPWALWLPTRRKQVAGTVLYYGTMLGPVLEKAQTPVLAHLAEHDEYEPDENAVAMEAALRELGREAEIHRYPGTSHWFAEPSRAEYVPAAAEQAFERTVAFLQRNLA